MTKLTLAAPAALLLLAACAAPTPTSWVNPTLPREQAAADLAACRRGADQSLGPGAYAPPDERNSDPMRLVDHTRMLNRFDRAVADCMEDKGYTRAK